MSREAIVQLECSYKNYLLSLHSKKVLNYVVVFFISDVGPGISLLTMTLPRTALP
jgi:hypothetical protein